MKNKQDLILGKIAIAAKSVTKEEIEHCLLLQEQHNLPLGIILLNKRLVEESVLEQLVKQQQKHLTKEKNREKGEELAFCSLLLKKHLLTSQEFRVLLENKKQDVHLTEMLLERDLMPLRDFLNTYYECFQETFECHACQKKFNLAHLNPGKKVRCKHCQTIFHTPNLQTEVEKYGVNLVSIDVDDDVLNGYRLIEQIAEGGMGIVYRAEKISSDEIVALKVLKPEQSASEEALTRFSREILAMSQLRHPYIVSILDTGVAEGQPYFTMDFIEGQPLSTKIENGTLEMDESVQMIIKICEGLDYAHKLDIVHRDIKPSNVLVTPEGDPKITDFGLAKCEDGISITGKGALLGTPTYMSPEQVQSKLGKIGPRSDIFSVGVVLYQMLTFDTPFKGDNSIDLYHNICTSEPKPPRELNKKIPNKLSKICLKCLGKEPFHRYKSASDLIEELKNYDKSFWDKLKK